VNGSCIFSGASKIRYTRTVRIITENDCTIVGATAVGMNVNFYITCLSSNTSFDLECYAYTNNGNEKIVKVTIRTGTVIIHFNLFPQ